MHFDAFHFTQLWSHVMQCNPKHMSCCISLKEMLSVKQHEAAAVDSKTSGLHLRASGYTDVWSKDLRIFETLV